MKQTLYGKKCKEGIGHSPDPYKHGYDMDCCACPFNTRCWQHDDDETESNDSESDKKR